jgi:hypothetical protein
MRDTRELINKSKGATVSVSENISMNRLRVVVQKRADDGKGGGLRQPTCKKEWIDGTTKGIYISQSHVMGNGSEHNKQEC